VLSDLAGADIAGTQQAASRPQITSLQFLKREVVNVWTGRCASGAYSTLPQVDAPEPLFKLSSLPPGPAPYSCNVLVWMYDIS
jgi:hypothetical protein